MGVLGLGLFSLFSLFSVLADEFRAQGGELGFEKAAVMDGLSEEGDEGAGDMHAASAFAVHVGEDEGGVFSSLGAGLAVGTDAGFADLSEGAFGERPEGFDQGEELVLGFPRHKNLLSIDTLC